MKLVTFLIIFPMLLIGSADAAGPALIKDQGTADMHSAPNEQSSIVSTIPKNEIFKAEVYDETWCLVRDFRGRFGFVPRSQVKMLGAPADPDSKFQPAPSKYNSSQPAAPNQKSPNGHFDPSKQYSIAGISEYDTLNVRTGPGMNYPIATRLSNGATGIQVDGEPVLHGNDDWVHITFATGKGWTRPKYLSVNQAPFDEASSPTALVAPTPTPSPTPAISNNNDALVTTAVAAGGLYLLYKALTSGSNPSNDKKTSGYHTCPDCHGTGLSSYGGNSPCINCDGTGEVPDVSPLHEFISPLDPTHY